jgi:argininosuccinate lyase
MKSPEIQALLQSLQAALLDLAEQNAEVVMPGFTHLQVAQPVSFGHHMLAYVEMLGRDAERMADCRRRTNRMPLGRRRAGGHHYPSSTAKRPPRLLGFDARLPKFARMPCPTAILPSNSPPQPALVMMHISPPFGRADFVDEPALRLHRHCRPLLHRQLSIMPQKKNPDVPELVRGKSGRVIGPSGGPDDADERRSPWPTTKTIRKTKSRCLTR